VTISAKIIADSYNPKSGRITTFQLRYPRFIHAEFMTHRAFSRNASSSRAIPVEKMIADIIADTAMPIHWGKNQPGMQAFEECVEPIYAAKISDLDMVENRYSPASREDAWLWARDQAIHAAKAFHAAGYHKQVVNRILEPFMHISVVVTAADYANFFWLRCHKDAQPEIKALADAMITEFRNSEPRLIFPGEWHVPYVTAEEREGFGPGLDWTPLIKASTARCARVSYLTHDGKKPSMEADFALYDRLVGGEPLHASPTEHQASPDTLSWSAHDVPIWDNEHLSGNYRQGWVQHRKTLPGENHTTYEVEY
jgi:hypothetical protein